MEWLGSVSQLAQQTSITTKAIFATVVLVLIVRTATKKRYRLPPGPRPLPLLGNGLELKGVRLLDKLEEWKNKYGPIVAFYMGPKLIVVLNDFESLTEAYVKQGSDFSSRPQLYSISLVTEGFKDMTFAPYGEAFKYLRKITALALRQYLTGRQLEQRCYETLQPIVERMKQENGAFNPHRYMSLAIFNVLHGISFGTTLEIDDPAFVYMLGEIDKGEKRVGTGFLEDFFPPLRWWPTEKFKSAMTSAFEFNTYVLERVLEGKASFSPDNIKSLTGNIILAQQQALQEVDQMTFAVQFTDDHVKQVLVDVFRAGWSTSRLALDWLFLLLVAYPDVQRKMQEEIDRVVGDSIPGKEHRSKLVYTEAVLMESMRLYYVAPIGLPHETMRDTTVGGYDVPGKTTVLVNYTAIMNDPRYWPDPLKFKPERFIVSSEDGTGSKIVSSRQDGYPPFSLGHRSCVGESLAKLEILYLVAGLLQNLTFSYASQGEETSPDLRHSAKALTFSPRPYNVRVTNRKD